MSTGGQGGQNGPRPKPLALGDRSPGSSPNTSPAGSVALRVSSRPSARACWLCPPGGPQLPLSKPTCLGLCVPAWRMDFVSVLSGSSRPVTSDSDGQPDALRSAGCEWASILRLPEPGHRGPRGGGLAGSTRVRVLLLASVVWRSVALAPL